MTPASNEITVDGSNAMPPDGSAAPKLANNAFNSCARTMPPNNPATDATSPNVSASTLTQVRICRRDAPIVRSRADSRVRCATRIENVLWIENAATSIAMPAKMTRKVLNALRKSSPSWFRSCVVRWAGDRLDAARQHRLDAREQLLLRDTSSARTTMLVT